MLFSSLVFLFFFLPVTLAGYYLTPRRFRNGFLLLADLVFYGFGEPAFVLLMLLSIGINYAGGLLIGKAAGKARRRALAGALALDLLLLGVFKYAGFLGDTLRLLPPLAGLPKLEIPLPIGISFYTFQSMSYLIDVYREDCAPQRRLSVFGAYISLFPQLIAGPIVRYRDVERELADPHRESAEAFSLGAELFLVGLSKKVLLANPLGALWSTFSAAPESLGTVGAWVGAAAFSMQLYFDFSGYSDMACGLGRMFGFTFCRNFNYPYTAKTVSDFWRRWHMSLTGWFRDYVYIPLGGSRCSRPRALLNVAIVWMLTGLWHGANWNFVLWGLYYALLLVLEKRFLGSVLEKLPAAVSRIYTLVLVATGWVLFALEDRGMLVRYLSAMFGWSTPSGAAGAVMFANLPLLAVGVLACLPAPRQRFLALPEKTRRRISSILSVCALLLCTAALVSDSYNPFLYLRF